jgi:hypothetical protein
MALGNANWTAQGGGGNQQANAAQVSRVPIQVGVALNAIPNTLLQPGDIAGIRSLVGGPLGEAMAFRQVPGQPCLGMAINASSDGAVSAITTVGSGNATMTVAAAPHVPVSAKITTGGALGTMQVAFSVNGGAFGTPVVSSASAPWTYMVPGTFVRYSFPSGTYVLNDLYNVGITSLTVTKVGSGVPNATITASPLDYYEFNLTVANAGGFNSGVFVVSPDGGAGPTGGGSTMSNMVLPSTGVLVIPGVGVVLTIGQHTILITITTPGALGTAVYSYQVDGGSTVTSQATTPNSGSNYVVTIPGTGVTLTFAPGTYVNSSTYTVNTLGAIALGGGAIATVSQSWAGLQVTDSYSFFCAPPSGSTSDKNAAYTAIQNLRNVQFSGVHDISLPPTAASAVSNQATLDSAMATAFGNLLNLDAWSECPSAAANVSGFGDIVVSGGVAIRDVADTDAVVVAARGSDTNRTGLHAGTYRAVSPITGFKLLRPAGWIAAHRYVRTDPAVDLAAVASGPLPIYIPAGSLTIGRDESVTPSLDNVQINTLRTYPNMPNQAYFSITSGGGGWKKTTQQAAWQPANWVRVLNTMLAQLQPVAQQLMGANSATNADGTIEEHQRRDWSAMLDSAAKRAVGLESGGPYQVRQASAATVQVSPSSQLGVSPKTLATSYILQNLGEVTNEQNSAFFGGLLPAS